MYFLIKLFGMFMLLYTITMTHAAEPTNCYVGAACDNCAEGYYKFLGKTKVCCPDCSKYFRSGFTSIDGISTPYCDCNAEYLIEGDCWKGRQCEECLAGPNCDYVDFIDSVPFCCKNCEKSGLKLHTSETSTRCNCLHNGP